MTASAARQPRGQDYRQLGVRIRADLIDWVRLYASQKGVTANMAVALALERFRNIEMDCDTQKEEG